MLTNYLFFLLACEASDGNPAYSKIVRSTSVFSKGFATFLSNKLANITSGLLVKY